ncbi:phage tail protein I [Paractinoplanes maris]|uniref:phage tail protein I n=1 Tax=Paractinoplanes maris TaxID=1734446 RepID=UPI0020215B30|nr:phage tail protein I [Actinoplanes maris]
MMPEVLPAPPSPYLTDPGVRRFAPVGGAGAAWLIRDGTRVDPESGDLMLDAEPGGPAPEFPAGAPEVGPVGLAFDRDRCLYRGDPAREQIQRLPWPEPGPPVDLLATSPSAGRTGTVAGWPLRTRALATDSDDHLFVLDGTTGRIAVLDQADGRLLRTVTPADPPIDLAGTGGRLVLALTASLSAPLVRLDAIGRPAPAALDPRAAALLAPRPGPAGSWPVPPRARPARLAVGPDGAVWILLRDNDDGYLLGGAGQVVRVPGARDIEVDGRGRVVVAGPPGDRLLTWTDDLRPGPVLRARGYDGRGIARTPDGGIGYSGRTGFRAAVPERVRHLREGTAGSPGLDGQSYGSPWGRVFVEACVPPGTTVELAAGTGDDPPTGSAPDGRWHPLHRRETGRELPWSPPAAGDRFEVLEAPIVAPPGRYLRLWLRFTGTGVSTPRVRAVRAEIPGRDLITKLPRTYRRDPAGADLLRRFLAIIGGQLGDIEARAVQRDLLFDPYGAPAELLPWLASLIGLTLDTRWPEQARRTLLAEAAGLFRVRGTVAGLRRTLEIYLGEPVVVLESFRLRGRAAAVGGAADRPGPFDAVLGAGWRVVGGPATPAAGPRHAPHSAAHRFSVLLTGLPDDEQLAVVRDLLDLHRPAHTLVEICPLGPGMRVGMSLHVEISSSVGAGSGVRRLRAGEHSGFAATSQLGTDGVIGRGRAGVRVGGAELGRGTVIDP